MNLRFRSRCYAAATEFGRVVGHPEDTKAARVRGTWYWGPNAAPSEHRDTLAEVEYLRKNDPLAEVQINADDWKPVAQLVLPKAE